MLFQKYYTKFIIKRIICFVTRDSKEGQKGFTQHRTTLTAIRSSQHFSDGSINLVSRFFVLIKAYNCTQYNILLNKCISYGLRHATNLRLSFTYSMQITQPKMSASTNTTYHAFPHYAIISILLLLPLSSVRTFSSISCLQKPSIYVLHFT
jgi:hypothetical protein